MVSESHVMSADKLFCLEIRFSVWLNFPDSQVGMIEEVYRTNNADNTTFPGNIAYSWCHDNAMTMHQLTSLLVIHSKYG